MTLPVEVSASTPQRVADLSPGGPVPGWTTRSIDQVAGAVVRAVVRRATGGAVAITSDGLRPTKATNPTPPKKSGTYPRSSPTVTVSVNNPAAYRSVLLGGSVGLGQSYAAGWWDTDDLVGLIRQAIDALPAPDSPLAALGALVGRLRGEQSSTGGTGAQSLARDRANIQAHYDLGDDFFGLFLDPTLTYSCGIFDTPSASMEDASKTKIDRLCTKLRLCPDDEVLEIGTGWGSFALHAASHYGCRVTTTTISDRQFCTARRRVAEAGLEHLVSVKNADYRDLSGTFDKVVSIEMIEAVGWRVQDRFFEVCADRLRPTGAMALQAIVIDDRLYERAKRQEDFVKALIFPGSTIPSLGSISASASRTDLEIVDREDIGAHYVETLARWRARFLENRDRIGALGYTTELIRLWDLYLAYCQAGFESGRIGDVQLILAKPGWRLVKP